MNSSNEIVEMKIFNQVNKVLKFTINKYIKHLKIKVFYYKTPLVETKANFSLKIR